MNLIKRCLIIMIFLSYLFFQGDNLFSQITNIKFTDLGETILVKYKFNGQSDKKYKVTLTLSDDYGATFKIKPRSMTGDVGKNILADGDKKITWYIKQDFPEGLNGSGFVFAIDAETQKSGSKVLWFAGG